MTTYPEPAVYSCEHNGRHFVFSLTELRYKTQDDFDLDAAEGFERRKANVPMLEVRDGSVFQNPAYAAAPFGVVIVYTKTDLESKELSDIKLDPIQSWRALLVKLPIIDLANIAAEYLAPVTEKETVSEAKG